MTAADQKLLNRWLPRGWYSKACTHFEGKHSPSLISAVKNGDRQNLEVLTWLIDRAREYKRASTKVTESLRSLNN